MCKHWGVLGVPGWQASKNKCKTAGLAHCTVSVMCIWVSKEGWFRVRRALMLSLVWITLYYVKDLISSKILEVFCTAILSAPKLIIRDSSFTLVDFFWAFTSWSFVIFRGGIHYFCFSLLLLDANTRLIMGGYRHLWHIQKYLVHLARKTKLLLSLVLNTSQYLSRWGGERGVEIFLWTQTEGTCCVKPH